MKMETSRKATDLELTLRKLPTWSLYDEVIEGSYTALTLYLSHTTRLVASLFCGAWAVLCFHKLYRRAGMRC